MSAGRFAGKVALVTGAASGIGRATAERLEAEGIAGLVLIDRDNARLEALAADHTLTRAFDVADEAAWSTLESEIVTRFGRLDYAVACAGTGLPEQRIATMALEGWRGVMAANLDGSFLTLRTGFRLMREGGAMVLLSSATAVKAAAEMAPYAVSKAAIAHLARVAALEGAPSQIRVNAIQPGGVETPLFRGLGLFQRLVAATGSEAAAFAALGQRSVPLGRYARAAEIAGQICFLLSDDAATMTGSVLVSDGGMTV